MNILLTLLKIRTLQFVRMIKEIGWVLILLVLPIIFIFLMAGLETISKGDSNMLIALVFLAIAGIHFQRNDRKFLEKLSFPLPFIYISEYVWGVLPLVLIAILATGQIMQPLLLLLAAVIVGLFPARKKAGKGWVGNWSMEWIPIRAFEWRAGIRKHWPTLFLMYFIPLFLAHYTAACLLGIVLTTVTLSAFYVEVEGKEIFEEFPKPFLWNKVKFHSGVLHVIFLPFYVLFLVFHSGYWYLLLYVVMAMQSLLIFVIFYKYAQYHPRRPIIYNQTQMGLMTASLLILWFLPLAIVFLVIYGQRAVKNLKQLYA